MAIDLNRRERVWIVVALALALIVLKPSFGPLQAFLGPEVIEGVSGEATIEYIPMAIDERAESANLTVIPITNIGTYNIDVGEVGTDFTGTGWKTFDIKDNINRYMTYCSLKSCNVPVTVTPDVSGNFSLELNINKSTITITEPREQISKAKFPKVLSTNILLIVLIAIIGGVLLLNKSNPPWWREIKRKL